ncbi:type II toxin-antitoxin system HigB family toxin [Nostoc sp. TCL26-01]|uniref:type II toxin-antitoxin system HigB family toxin n=1 Tax=Nostoc sp. TCL26-01 TaxID=2576904 RepID=UPI0015BBBCDC|nr:type II toxin-antitoxin system HigB family toxin [Nostoc sp. TCL26-01]QLE56795.1 type II toxin-antitoxin system HigB family toxin [Nostoc sp. TCL26-01]
MRIITKKRLNQASEQYPDAESSIRAWSKLVKAQDWNSFEDIKATSIFAPDRVKNFVIFDIGGNKYRLITYIDYKTKAIFIRGFLTHAEYDKDKWKNDEWFNG